MSKKFNKVVELYIAEEQDKARAALHEACVEMSRDIFRKLLEEEDLEEMDLEEGDYEDDEDMDESVDLDEVSDDETRDYMDDVTADEEGDDEDYSDEDDEDDEGLEGDAEDLGDEVDQLKSDLEDLKAEFDALMGGDDDEMDMDGDDMDMDGGMDDEFDMDGDVDMDLDGDDAEMDDEEELVREYTEKQGGDTYDKFAPGGDDGANKKSTLHNKGDLKSGGASPVKTGSGSKETGRKMPKTKEQSDFGTTQEAGKKKLQSAPKPKHSEGSTTASKG